jgi:thiosulfate reductase cytochrome b subunit
MVFSGLLYMFYRYPQQHQVISLNLDGLEIIGLVHTAGAFLLAAFFIAHFYLITTGQTITSNLRAMLSGFEEISDEPGRHGTPIHSTEPATKE